MGTKYNHIIMYSSQVLANAALARSYVAPLPTVDPVANALRRSQVVAPLATTGLGWGYGGYGGYGYGGYGLGYSGLGYGGWRGGLGYPGYPYGGYGLGYGGYGYAGLGYGGWRGGLGYA